jgi:hypothetical protein
MPKELQKLRDAMATQYFGNMGDISFIAGFDACYNLLEEKIAVLDHAQNCKAWLLKDGEQLLEKLKVATEALQSVRASFAAAEDLYLFDLADEALEKIGSAK